MKRDLHFYTAALENHKPLCCLPDAAPGSSSTPCLSVSRSADCQAGSSPPGDPPQASTSTAAAAPSLCTSLTSGLDLQTPDCVKSTHLSPSTPALTTTTSSSSDSSSYEFFTSSSSRITPYSTSWSTALAPRSLFSDDLPPLITSNVTPVCTSSLITAAIPRRGATHEHSMSANACSSALHSDALDAFLMDQASFQRVSSNVPPYAHLAAENTALAAQGCLKNAPQLHPAHFSGNLISSNVPRSLLPSTLQEPVHQSLSVSPQGNPEPSPASAFASKPSSSQHVSFNSASLLSQLTAPSPINVSLTTSSSFDGSLAQPPTSPSALGATSKDLSFSELLEVNDWILQ